MKNILILLVFITVASCGKDGNRRYEIYKFNNESTKDLSIKFYSENLLLNTFDILSNNYFADTFFVSDREKNLPFYLIGSDSVYVLFNNEKFIYFTRNSDFNNKNIFEINEYSFEEEYIDKILYRTGTFVFAEEDYSLAEDL